METIHTFSWAARCALAMTCVLSLGGCGLYSALPAYEGLVDGDACGPCDRGTWSVSACELGELEGLVNSTDSCEAIVHLDMDSSVEGELDGSPERPFASLSRALDSAIERSASVVLVAGQGDYEGPFVVHNGVHVLGGYAAGTFELEPELVPTFSMSSTREDTQNMAMIARAISSRTLVRGVRVVARGEGWTQVGALIENSPGLELEDIKIEAGPGAAGVPGAPGTVGDPGGAGDDGGTAPGTMSVRTPGDGGINTSCMGVQTRGARGGQGAFVSSEGDVPPRRGDSSEEAAGGASGRPGAPGADGVTGPNGMPAALPPVGEFVDETWTAQMGESGGDGQHGGGGGGGGGADVVDPYPQGGGGGGGGAGGCGGSGGEAGGPGGASVGMIVLGEAPSFVDGVEIMSSKGGDGGVPGAGGEAGLGGMGGAGKVQEEASGGDGGMGGDGGSGGEGAPGVPGPSIGIKCERAIELDKIEVTSGDAGVWAGARAAQATPALALDQVGCQ